MTSYYGTSAFVFIFFVVLKEMTYVGVLIPNNSEKNNSFYVKELGFICK